MWRLYSGWKGGKVVRIRNNITAMNANRNFNTNSSALSTSVEKLSSGYRINRSADDAAGLAISEKMRALIRGLGMANENCQDGVSLLQIAEGALQEVHDILGRMDVLAIQSANGTYDDGDRAHLQKEVDQLKTEIDRIADTANFNGIKLLDGSLKVGGVFVSGYSVAPAALENTGKARAIVIPGRPAIPEIPAKKTSFQMILRDLTMETDGKVEVTLGTLTHRFSYTDLGSNTTVTAATLAEKIVDQFKANPTVGGQAFVLSAEGGTLNLVQAADPRTSAEVVKDAPTFRVSVVSYPPSVEGTAATGVAFGAKADIQKNTLERKIYNLLVDPPSLKGSINVADFEVDGVADYMRKNGITGDAEDNRNNNFCLIFNGVNNTFQLNLMPSVAGNTLIAIGGPVSANFPSAAGQNSTIDFSAYGFGKIIIKNEGGLTPNDFGSTTYQTVSVAKKAAAQNGGSIDFGGLVTEKLAQAAKKSGANAGETGNIKLKWNTDHLELYSETDGKVIATTKDALVGMTGTNQIAFYDKDNVSIGTITIAMATGGTLDADSFKNMVGKTDHGVEVFTSGLNYKVSTLTETKKDRVDTTVVGNIYVAGQEATPDVTIPDPTNPNPPADPNPPATPGTSGATGSSIPSGKGLGLQIGDTSRSYDRMMVIIDDMHARAMGIRDKDGNQIASVAGMSVKTQESSLDAIDIIKGASIYVSAVRSDLGAYQNRLEHTMNNLSVTLENIQSSESKIRDTDMATEMMAGVRSRILIQSTQSVLAQANQTPERVLKLLR